MLKFVPVTCAFSMKKCPNSQAIPDLLWWKQRVCRVDSKNGPDKT